MLLAEIPFVNGKRVRVKSKEFMFFKTGYPHAGKSGVVIENRGLELKVRFDSGEVAKVGYDTLALLE